MSHAEQAPLKVREAKAEDLTAIVRIYNHAIETSVATFDTEPFTVDRRHEWFAQFGRERPLLVCEAGGAVAGFAYYLPYHAKPGYARTMETTLYVDPAYQRRGVGSALYEELIERARSAGVHVLIAVLDGENGASRAIHRKLGFEQVGYYREVGYKFGAWIDTTTFQKIL